MPPILITDGPFAGWHRWREMDQGRFQDLIGAVYFRARADGTMECRSATGRQHSNMQDMLHGGYIMAFVDQVLFAIAAPRLAGLRAVTVTCTTDFLGAGKPGDDLFATGEVTRETGKMLFIRGMVEQGGPVASFSAVLRKVTPRS